MIDKQHLLFVLLLLLLTTFAPWEGGGDRLLLVQGQQQQGIPEGRTVVHVRYGYFPEARPIHAACARGWFDLDVPTKSIFYQVTCYPQTSGNFAASRLDNLDLDLANLGSTPWAQAVARGVDAVAVYISQYAGNSQGLYVRPSSANYTRIQSPYDLQGRTIAVPFGSTMHYQILFLLDLLNLSATTTTTNNNTGSSSSSSSVKLIDMSPSEIIQAWDAKTIDAAGCWGTARAHLLERNAITLVSAGLLATWGRETFVVVAATRTFAEAHQEFMQHIVGILSRLNDSFLDRLGQEDSLNIQRWDHKGTIETSSLVPSMVDALMLPDEIHANPSEERLYSERLALDDFIQKSAKEQISCQYLGPGPQQCDSPTLTHISTLQTADFLLDQKILSGLGPLVPMGNNENGQQQLLCKDRATFCGSDILNGAYLEMARRSCNNCLPVGRYAAGTEKVSSSSDSGGTDELLSALEMLDRRFNRTGFAPSEIGRAPGGDSTCSKQRTITVGPESPTTGVFGDGANAEPGKSYSDNLECRWVLRGVDCTIPSDDCQSIVEVKLNRLRLWSADFIRVYSNPDFKCQAGVGSRVLLGKFSGIYKEGDTLPPSIQAVGCLEVVFETDSNHERSYGSDVGDGFLISYDLSSNGCIDESDCNGHSCSQNGLCECGGQSWGATCSETRSCLGTTRLTLEEGKPQVLSSSASLTPFMLRGDAISDTRALDPVETYPNDLDCRFDIEVPRGNRFVNVQVFYDLEPTYDLLRLETGSDTASGGPETYAVLTGTQNSFGGPETYYLPTKDGFASLRITTDGLGRRRGFYATVAAMRKDDNGFLQPNGCPVPGQSGYGCETQHCITQNALALPQQRPAGPYVIGRVVSQTPDYENVPAMPWAPEGGCIWSLASNGLPAGADDAVALRLAFNTPLDLEPHPISSVGDKLVIRQQQLPRTHQNKSEFDSDMALFVEQCDSDEACSFPWQTGVCGDSGGCIVRAAIDVPLHHLIDDTAGTSISALLMTDRNDRGHIYSGLDFDVLLVKECPSEDEDIHCENAGGECVDGVCYCNDVACSCRCEGEPATISTGVKIGIVLAAVVPVFVAFVLAFFWYRRRKIRKSRAQKAIIKEKEAELEAFRDSVVGLRTATKTYVPAVSKSIGEECPIVRQAPPPPASQTIWCWKETDGRYMANHDIDSIVGDPSDCWIKYSKEANAKLAAAFEEQGASGDCSPLPGYVVNFDTMTQTKIATGFLRDVKRVTTAATPSPEIEMSDVEFGDTLPSDLTEEPQMVLVEGDLVQISKQHTDNWAFGTKLQHADEAMARQLVLAAIGGGDGVDDSSVLTDTGWFKLDATRVPSGEDLAALHSQVGHSGALEPPPHWAPVVDPTVVQRHILPEGHSERDAVEQALLKTLTPAKLGKKVKILRVERVENLSMWQSYVVKRQTICYREALREGVDVNQATTDVVTQKALDRFERHWLWHGSNAETLEKILQQGFNRSFCGKNATVFGKGVYFARDAAYSANSTYAVPGKDGVQYLLACRVVVGEYCLGKADALTPDLRDANKNILFDSTVGLYHGDSMSNPPLYVTYHDSQAYPEYLIAFKTSSRL